MFINDVTEDSAGNIYWSVTSTMVELSMIMFESLAGPTGR